MNPTLREAINAGLAITTCAVIAVVFYHWPAIYHWRRRKRGKRNKPNRRPYEHWQTYDPTLDSWDEDERPGNWRAKE